MSGRNEVITMRVDTSGRKNIKTREKINKTMFFAKNNKIDKSLSHFIQKKGEIIQITKISNKSMDIIIDLTEIQRVIKAYIEQLHDI